MEVVNRIALIVRPKRRYLEWIRRSNGPRVTEEMLPSFETVYLLEGESEAADLQELIDEYADELFEHQLEQWSENEDLWPPNRTPHVFRDWFDARVIDLVCDADPDAPWSLLELDDDEEGDVDAQWSTCAWCGGSIEGEVLTITGRLPQPHQVEGIESGTFEVPLGDRTVVGLMSAPDSEARKAGADFLFVFCGEACGLAFKAAWNRERGALLS